MKAAADLASIREWERAIGIRHADAYVEKGYFTGGKWRAQVVEDLRGAVVRALTDSCTRISTRSKQVRHLTVDVDAHGVLEREAAREVRSLDAWLSRGGSVARARRRAAIASACRSVVDALRELGLPWLFESSPRGLHADLFLDRAMPVEWAQAVAGRIVATVEGACGAGVAVEPFPRSSGWSCALPLTGSARILGDDLVRPVHRTRAEDRWTLAQWQLASADELARRFGATGDAKADMDTRVSMRAGREARRVSPAQQLHDEPGSGEQLFGAAFVREVLRLHTAGFDAGGSYDAARRIAWAYFATNIAAKDAHAAFAALLHQPIHRARHCQTARGRAELIDTFRSCWRRLERGDLERRMRCPELRRAVRQLLGDRAPIVAISTAGRPSAKGKKRGRKVPEPKRYVSLAAQRRAVARAEATASFSMVEVSACCSVAEPESAKELPSKRAPNSCLDHGNPFCSKAAPLAACASSGFVMPSARAWFAPCASRSSPSSWLPTLAGAHSEDAAPGKAVKASDRSARGFGAQVFGGAGAADGSAQAGGDARGSGGSVPAGPVCGVRRVPPGAAPVHETAAVRNPAQGKAIADARHVAGAATLRGAS